MIDDIDIYRSAQLLMDQHGEWGVEAAMKADAMMGRGDLEGHRVWSRVLKAINELRTMKDGDRPS